MASSLNEHSLEKKLATVNNTQDSIQTLSLWILHHKVHHQKIVQIWFKVLKKVKVNQRLTLFYVANDVIQHSKRKGLNVFLDSFSEVLKDATLVARDDTIKNSISRIFNIWDERSVYGSDLINELQAIIDNTKSEALVSNKLLAEFKQPKSRPKRSKAQKPVESTPDEVSTTSSKASLQQGAEINPQKIFDALKSFRMFENEVELKRRLLNTFRLDASSTEALKNLKDRAHGNKFSKEFEEATLKLDDYVMCQEKEILDRKNLLELLDQTQLFYSTQYGEAKIVANAYKNFGTRINNLKKKLDDLKKNLPDPTSPIPSPTADAPSPGDSPPDDPSKDNVQSIDMELSDDDAEGPAGNILVSGVKNLKGWYGGIVPEHHITIADVYTGFNSGMLDRGSPLPQPLDAVNVSPKFAAESLKPPVNVVKPIIAAAYPAISPVAQPVKSPIINSTTDKPVVSSPLVSFDKPVSIESPKTEAYSPAGSVDSAPSPEGSPIGLVLSPSRTPSESAGSHIPVITSQANESNSPLQKDSPPSSPPPSIPETLLNLNQGTSSLDSRLSSLLQNLSNLPPGLQNSFLGNMSPTPVQSPPPPPPFIAAKPVFDAESNSPTTNFVPPSSSTSSSEVAGGTPLKDEGNTTPLQDEEVDQLPENPIEFLTRIISKSHGQGGLDFLENLSSLTSKVKLSLDSDKQMRPNDAAKEIQSNYPAVISTPTSEAQTSFSNTQIVGSNSQTTLDYDSLEYSDSLDYSDSWKVESSNTPVVTSQYSSSNLWSSSPISSGTPQITSPIRASSLSVLSTQINQISSGQLLKSKMNSVLPPSINSELSCGSSPSVATSLNLGIPSLSTSQNSSLRATILPTMNINHPSSGSSSDSQSPQPVARPPVPPSVPPPTNLIIASPLSHHLSAIRPQALPKPILKNSLPISRPPFPLDIDFRQSVSVRQNLNIVELTQSDTQDSLSLDSETDQNDDASWTPFSSKISDEDLDGFSFEGREPQPPSFRPPALPSRNISSHEIPNNQNEFLQKLKEKTSPNFPATFPPASPFTKSSDDVTHLPPPPPLPSSSQLKSVISNLKTLVPYNNNSDQDSDRSSGEEESTPAKAAVNPPSSPEEGECNIQDSMEETHNIPGTDNFEGMKVQKIETTLEQRMKREQQYRDRHNNFDPMKWPPTERTWSGSRHEPYKPYGFEKPYERDRKYDPYERDPYSRRDPYPRHPQRNTYFTRNEPHMRPPNKRPYPYPPRY